MPLLKSHFDSYYLERKFGKSKSLRRTQVLTSNIESMQLSFLKKKKILLLKSLFYSLFIWQRGYKIRSRQKHWTHITVVMSQKGLKYAVFCYSFLEIFCFYQLYFEITVAQTRLWEIVIQQFENVSADFCFTASCHPSWSHLTKYLPYNFSPFSLPVPEFSSSSSPTW